MLFSLSFFSFFLVVRKWAENKNINLLSMDWKYFFFRSAPFLSQLSVYTAKGSNGSCLYKRKGAQINSRENLVYLEPLAKTKLSTMWNKTGHTAELQSPCTLLMISKLCDCFAALLPLIQRVSVFRLLLSVCACLQTLLHWFPSGACLKSFPHNLKD